MSNYQFEDPAFLWLLLLLPLVIFYLWYSRNKQRASLTHSTVSVLADNKANWKSYLVYLPNILRVLSLALIIIALGKPRTAEENTKTKSEEGIDIILALDLSSSMLARDLQPNRLQATKEVAADFVQNRKTDRIGLVVYAAESFTQAPLTSDHRIILNSLKDLRQGTLEDGTAIGMGLASSVNRLKDSKAKSKVIILLSDGENNSGEIDPITAANLADDFGIRVYTIGVGTKGTALQPVGRDMRGRIQFGKGPVNIDETLLKAIAEKTNGQYFRATDNKSLETIYSEIDKLEKTKIKEIKYYTYDEKFSVFLFWALGLFLFEILLKLTYLRSFI